MHSWGAEGDGRVFFTPPLHCHSHLSNLQRATGIRARNTGSFQIFSSSFHLSSLSPLSLTLSLFLTHSPSGACDVLQ